MTTDPFDPDGMAPRTRRRRDDRLPLQSEKSEADHGVSSSETDLASLENPMGDDIDAQEDFVGTGREDEEEEGINGANRFLSSLKMSSSSKASGANSLTTLGHGFGIIAAIAMCFPIVWPSGFGAILGLIVGLIALVLNSLFRSARAGQRLALVAVIVSVLELSVALYMDGQKDEMGDDTLQVANQFLETFSRYEEGEIYGEQARNLMSVGLKNSLKPPLDERLSFDISDKFGRLTKLSCNRKIIFKGALFSLSPFTLPSIPDPTSANLDCHADYTVPGPPIHAHLFLLREQDAWKVQNFTVKSPLRGVVFQSHVTPSHLTYGGR